MLEIDPHHAAALNNLAFLYIRGARNRKMGASSRESMARRALEYLDRAIEAEADRPELHYNRGLALLLLRRLGEATSAFDSYLSLLPEGPERARELFGVPEDFEVVTAIAIGYAADPESLPPDAKKTDTTPRQRKPISEIVFGGEWGNPAKLAE